METGELLSALAEWRWIPPAQSHRRSVNGSNWGKNLWNILAAGS